MSPWSRALRRLLLLLVLAPAGLGAAQETAILHSGPTAVRGIPFLPPNVLPAFVGRYTLPSQEATVVASRELPPGSAVEVLYTRRPLALPDGWDLTRCAGLGLLRVPEKEGRPTLCYRSERGFTLFFRFPGPEPPAYACPFVQQFVRQFVLLLGFSNPEREVPFPAVLQLAG